MKLKNKMRLLMQVIVVGLVVWVVIQAADVEAYCPLGGLLSIGSRFVRGSSSCQMGETQMFLGVTLVFGIFVLGKLFCSHICPIGTLSEWLGRAGRKLKIQLQRLPIWMDKSLRVFKYLLLLPVLYYTAVSSELFCKKFDPYFAATTGFGLDVVFWWAILAVIIVIIGSIFIRQFWCKYFCPLGALSNIFMFSIFSVSTLIIYIILTLFGLKISIFWLFLIWISGGFLIEILSKKSQIFPLLPIERDASTCIDCKLCDIECPYDIIVSQLKIVRDVDCTMCADCIPVCPVENCMTIKKKNMKWLPAFATVLLISLSLGFSSRYELTTLSERWGELDTGIQLSRYETVVKSVKCFGTASGLKRKIEKYDGIYGMDAYAQSHKVVLYYNSAEIDENGIKKAIFSPYKAKLAGASKDLPETLQVAYFGVLNLNDNIDNANFYRTLSQSKHVYGFESDYGEPVRVLIYIDTEKITIDEIEQLIETKKIKYKLRNNKEYEAELDFKVQQGPDIIGTIDTPLFFQHIFVPYDGKIKKFIETPSENRAIYQIGMPNLGLSAVRRYLPYLFSHLSHDDGILGLETFYTDLPIGWIYFDATFTDTTKVKTLLTSPKMKVMFSSGETREYNNPFKVSGPFTLKSVEDINLIKQELDEKTGYLANFGQ